MLKEFRPALMFLGKFLIIYLLGNVLYGLYIESFSPRPDVITAGVTKQSAALLRCAGFETYSQQNPYRPTVALIEHDDVIVNVFEGCNGVNVLIVFFAFLFAFGGNWKKMLWFIPLGMAVIHLFNLLRIMLLYYVAIEQQKYFYYFHKYFFTAILYLVVFALWAMWITINRKTQKQAVES